MVFTDTHSHFYSLFKADAFFDAAYANFENTWLASEQPHDKAPCYVLILNDRAGQNWFERFAKFSDATPSITINDPQIWIFEPLPDPLSLKVVHSASQRFFYIMSGYQSVTREGIEILSLFTRERAADRAPLEDTLAFIQNRDGFAVLPWSPGKWIGNRGDHIFEFLRATSCTVLGLGDVPSRLFDKLSAKHFKLAGQKGIPVVSGSDPLPISGACNHPGRFGTLVETELDPLFPSRSLREALADPKTKKKTLGRRESIWEFLRNQTLLRILGRRGKAGDR